MEFSIDHKDVWDLKVVARDWGKNEGGWRKVDGLILNYI